MNLLKYNSPTYIEQMFIKYNFKFDNKNLKFTKLISDKQAKNELKQVVKIFNYVINKYDKIKNKLIVNETNFNHPKWGEHISWSFSLNNGFKSNDKINNYLIEIAKNRKEDYGVFFQYIKYEYVLKILVDDKIRLYSLSSQLKNDPVEQSEFLKRFTSLSNKYLNEYEESKSKSFIYCFTDSYTNERMWKEYASSNGKYDGIVIGYRFKNFSNKIPYSNLYSFKNVIYEGNYEFDFINEIQFNLEKKIGKRLINIGLETFAKYYKRSKYAWENETRLVFDLNDYYKLKKYNYNKTKIELSNKFTIYNDDDDREYIILPLNNKFFKIEIAEIICGKDVSSENFNNLKSLVNDNVNVWQRKT